MPLEFDVYGGVFQCYVDQYACESLCHYECWAVSSCEHRSTFNYICIPKPKIIVSVFLVWCILTMTSIVIIAHMCWKVSRPCYTNDAKVHATLIQSVSSLDEDIENSSMVVATSTD
ncbi:hypothetical protein KIN20_016101 [Parelaphostrongylus tenuis]|uniref:Uncharacterized protein n=1 Tax=Parelaphostrongylus tenuis TaxID=148309 RepID=A0AAD5MKR0_PARTN|nr:hypothetical protein KIN20_016101 [Parelaphostrongylus tenuis]